MAQKINNQPANNNSRQAQNPASKNKPQTTGQVRSQAGSGNAVTTGKAGFLDQYGKLIIPLVIGVLTFLSLKTIINNKLTNWDDLGYIITNPLIKDSSADGIKRILGFYGLQQACVMGNYHPFTILLYMFEYSYQGLEPMIYHLDSLLLHMLCTIAVYYFTKVFTGRTVAATITALLFGLHPMHVESVAWGAGRKDVLYGLFYVLSCTTYIKYIRAESKDKAKWYIAGVLLFALSLLAKSVAVTLPVTLFLFDYFEGRELFNADANGKKTPNIMLVVEKIPHFGLSLLFGLLSIWAQKDIGALASLDANFNVLERAALGCYALTNYLWKVVIPTGLCNFYPYPLKIGDALPVMYYSYLAIVIGLLFVLWKFGRKNKVVLFGVGFFLINIVLLLQFLPVGGAIMSDRYGYIPYLGLFLMAGWFVSDFFTDPAKEGTGKMVFGAVVAYCLILGYATNERAKVWYDSITMWKDDAEKHPDGPVAYFYLGQEYFTRYEASTNPNEKKMLGDSSLYFFNMSMARKPDYINPLICIGELQRNYGLIDDAKATYYKAMKISKTNESVYLGLGVVFSIKHQFDSANICFKEGIRLKAYFPEGHSNYANYLDIVGKVDSSLIEYAYSINQNPDAVIPYLNRARIFMRLKRWDEAIKDYDHAIILKPESGESYYLCGRCYASKGDNKRANSDTEKAKSLGYAPKQ